MDYGLMCSAKQKLKIRTKYVFGRFVRFVSTPEILERVYTIESEILQIEEAIAIQGNNDTGLSIVSIAQFSCPMFLESAFQF